MKILKMAIKKQYFDDIESGLKKKEFREYKQYWISRLVGKRYDVIELRNGYQRNSPKLLVEYYGYTILDGTETLLGDMKQFAINLGRIIE